MTTITLETSIKNTIEAVFNRSLDIDFHKKSTSKTKETAIAGVTSGIIGPHETVTWRGKHFGVFLTHTSLISSFEKPYTFTDEMIEGNFKSFKHVHTFSNSNGVTTAKDVLKYETPFGIFGKLFDFLFLKRHLTKFLSIRNLAIKNSLEG
ncbi:MAG: ligand-binding SRPBCC domain-containing protein [Flavobacteriales bacterium]|jgi:ligand-binding SRPBCC domain-containing protein